MVHIIRDEFIPNDVKLVAVDNGCLGELAVTALSGPLFGTDTDELCRPVRHAAIIVADSGKQRMARECEFECTSEYQSP